MRFCEEHNTTSTEVMGTQECVGCVLLRMSQPLHELYNAIKVLSMEDSLQRIKGAFDLSERDIVLMGWVWDEWVERYKNKEN